VRDRNPKSSSGSSQTPGDRCSKAVRAQIGRARETLAHQFGKAATLLEVTGEDIITPQTRWNA